MMRFAPFSILLLAVVSSLSGQDVPMKRPLFFEQQEQKFYLGFRFPQSYFLKTDLRIHGSANDPIAERAVPIDITIKDIAGKDDGFIYPAFFGALANGKAAPPMEIAFGYKFKNSSWGIGGRWIHYKYTMVLGQEKRVSGYIDTVQYNGSVQPLSFLTKYEHTDGHNMVCIGPEFHRTVVQSKNGNYALDFSTFLSPVLSVPRTEATIILPSGTVLGRNNRYKVSGGGVLGEVSLMASLWRYLGINLSANYSSVWYTGATILEDEPGDLKAQHYIGAITFGTAIFVQVPIKSKADRQKKRLKE